MSIITLSDELGLDSSAHIEVYDYRSTQEISKQQIILNKNTFSFLQEGKKEVLFNSSGFSIDASEFLLMKAGNCLMTEKISAVNKQYGSVLLFFSNEVVAKFIRKFNPELPGVKSSQSVHAFHYDSFIERFVASLLDIGQLPKAAQQNLLAVKFEEIMLYLMELYGSEMLYALMDHHDSQTQKFITTVESNKLNKLSLQELAFLCNMSISSFKRAFEKHYAESPSKWFQEQRLENAFNLLKDDHLRPSDIYADAGYENLSSFIQAYKVKFGVTPKQHHKT